MLDTPAPPAHPARALAVADAPLSLSQRDGLLPSRPGPAWELARHFHVLAPLSSPPASPAAGAFSALAGDPDAGPAPPLPPVEPIMLGAADPISIEAAPGGGFLILDRAEPAGRSVVTLYRDGLEAGAAATGDVVGQDMALVGDTLFVVDGAGNQAYAFELTLGPSGPVLQAELAYFPMRLYGGKSIFKR